MPQTLNLKSPELMKNAREKQMSVTEGLQEKIHCNVVVAVFYVPRCRNGVSMSVYVVQSLWEKKVSPLFSFGR
jgi:hypothetical protein